MSVLGVKPLGQALAASLSRERFTATLLGLFAALTLLLAAWPPARRAARVDPAVVLRPD